MMHFHRVCLVCLLTGLSLSGQNNHDSKEPNHVVKYSRQPEVANVAYGPHQRNVLDLWKAKTAKPAPLLIYFHPGGFTHGDKSWIEEYDKPMLDMCLERGISVASANYRFARQAPLPAAMEDGARAIQFLRLHAGEYNLDAKSVAAAGGSSGAIIAMWIGFHDDMADAASDDPVKRQSTRISVVGSIDGQTKFEPGLLTQLGGEALVKRLTPQLLTPAKGDELNQAKMDRRWAEISPLTYLTWDDPPVFAYYTHNPGPLPAPSEAEAVHNPRFGALLKEAMDQFGIECILRTPKDYPQGAHRPFTKDMVDFFLEYLPGAGLAAKPATTRK
jgi:acetyl esterase/lipase